MLRCSHATGFWRRHIPIKHAFERSLWAATAGKSAAPSTDEVQSAYDVIVVGGGIAGAVTLATLARGGARVLLLEAGKLASGATGRSGGFVVPSFPMSRPGAVISRHGDVGERLVAAVGKSADLLFSLVREFELDCDAIQGGWIHPTTSEEKLGELSEDAIIWRKNGNKVVLLGQSETQYQTGVNAYVGSSLAPSGGTVHPVKFVREMVSAAVRHGASYRENTPALSLEQRNGSWQVATANFKVSSQFVVVCTNGQSPSLTPALSRAVLPVRICQSASYPIEETDRAHLFGQGRCLSDTQANLFTYRFDADWRLISGAVAPLFTGTGARLSRRLADRLCTTLNLNGPVEQEFTWFGHASITDDYLPKAVELGPGGFALSACNGRGLAISALMASELARGILGGGLQKLILPCTELRPYPRRAMAHLGARLYPLYARIATSGRRAG